MESVWVKFLKQIAFRLLFVVPLIFIAIHLALQGGGNAFIGVGLLVTAGLIISTPFTELFSHSMGWMFFPNERAAKPILSYARADLYLRKEKYQEAAEEFAQVLKHYPQEVQAVIGKLCLMVQLFQKTQAAESFYFVSLKKILSGDAHKQLVEAYAMILAKKGIIVRKPRDMVYVTIYLPDDQMSAFRGALK